MADTPEAQKQTAKSSMMRLGGEKHETSQGLAIVKETAEAHGGKISVRSTLNEGSIFTVHLPLNEPDASSLIRLKK